MVLETSSHKEDAVREQQQETQLMRNEGGMPSRLEAEASGPARCGGAFHEDNHRYHLGEEEMAMYL
jgi:hypothetical protein